MSDHATPEAPPSQAASLAAPCSSEPTALHDILSGGLAGMTSIAVGQPFDTVKVRLQTSPPGVGSLAVVREAAASREGLVRSLFKGLAPPLATATAVNAIVFSVYGSASRAVDRYAEDLRDARDSYAATSGSQLPMPASPFPANHLEAFALTSSPSSFAVAKNFACGSFAGLVQTAVICPTEHVKCRLQADPALSSPLQCTRNILKQAGLPGLLRGFNATCLREVPSFGLYFAFYDWARERMLEGLPALPNWVSSVACGGASGALTWALVYPVDIIKTNIQTMPIDTPAKDRGMLTVAGRLVRKHGGSYLFRGLGVTVVRSFPVNGMIFPIYELSIYMFTTPYGAWNFSE
ncbi:hypothetical protein TeGR_g6656, partial [Tetraparma gracilis]